MARERRPHRAATFVDVRRANASQHRKRRHLQLQRNQKLARRSGLQEGAQAGSARPVAPGPGNKTLIKNRLLIREAKCFHLIPMRKAKTKSRAKIQRRPGPKNFERIPYQKPALRSDAFARALTNAKSCANNPESLKALFNEAARKAAAVPREP